MRNDDRVRLLHMLDAAHEATGFVQGRARTDLDSDRMLVLSLVKAIEIISEAANQVSKATREEFPEIPWADIIGMRNRLGTPILTSTWRFSGEPPSMICLL